MDDTLTHGSIYSDSSKTLFCNWNHGFFSNCTVTLWGLIDLYNSGIKPDHLDFSGGFAYYKTKLQTANRTDLYSHFFATNSNLCIEQNEVIAKPDHHGNCEEYDHENYKLFIKKYFGPSKQILKLQDQLSKKYNICFNKTIAVYYRGTDKQEEVKPIDPARYLATTENLLNTTTGSRILIQTDQQQIRDMFMHYFGQKCFYFHEAPVTSLNKGLHIKLSEEGADGYDAGMTFLAITRLISKCKYVINHRGNVSAWICLFRGHSNGITQFEEQEKSRNSLGASDT